WIAARYLQSSALLLAPLFIGRKVRVEWLLAGFSLISGLILFSIFAWQIFPVCYIEGIGLTPFKIYSEYIIDLIYAAAALHIFRNRQKLDPNLLAWLILGIAISMLAELAFTFYIDVYGLSNMVGHILRIFAAYLIYKAVIEVEASSMYTNLTSLVEAERDLRESEERFRYLADAMPQLVWMAKPDGTVDYYNQRYHEYNGIALGDNGEWLWAPVLHPDDVEQTLNAWQNAVSSGTVYEAEHRVKKIDGSFRWHLSRGIPVFDSLGRLTRWFGTATDIDDLKRAEVVLAESAQKLQHSNQELEQFALVASHDLQEPLRKITFFGNSLRKQLEGILSPETGDILDRMQNAAERMRVMINGLLDLSRVNSRERSFVPVDLTQAAKDALANLEEYMLASGGQVNIGPLPTIEADELQMRQLFQNLLANGLKFHRKDVPPCVSVSAAQNDGDCQAVTITIADNGIGFDEQYSERIFQPFQRLHGRSEYEGTGMGLAICQKIIERHHGQISVHSRPGEGSVFSFSLPLKQ
ncbi:MAG: PAS domain-containing protein, partial [Anaerolineaceae bacterium]|nr:PAS domain-containing protein [Anaerolineaceae bacterium]